MGKGLGTLENHKILRIGQVFILLAILSGWVFAQQTVIVTPKSKPTPKVKPVAKPKCENCPENPPTPSPEIPEVPPGKVDGIAPSRSVGGRVENEDDIPFEKSIEVDSKVNIGLCVSEGNIKINGWERDEIRVFVNKGSKAGFRIVKRNGQNKPAWLTILGYDPMKDKGKDLDQCLSGEEIELDVPMETTLSRLEGREGEVTISINSIAKANVVNNNGNVSLNGIEQGIGLAKTFEGDIFVENSSGAINLDSVNGSILVYNVEPVEVGDILKIKTNSGAVVLQSSTHSVVDATSISGSIKFTGEIQPEGQYVFRNTNGKILLGIPGDSSCLVQVLSGKNKFFYDVPLTITNETVFYPAMQKITGKIGEGEANLNLITQSGTITIKKIN